jgi:hypothetical protein
MNNNSSICFMYSSPNTFLLQVKERGVFAPLCKAERGWGEFI